MESKLEKLATDQDLIEEELPGKTIPHHRKHPINIYPNIVAEYLGVISIKMKSLYNSKWNA